VDDRTLVPDLAPLYELGITVSMGIEACLKRQARLFTVSREGAFRSGRAGTGKEKHRTPKHHDEPIYFACIFLLELIIPFFFFFGELALSSLSLSLCLNSG
jgi:hypothetical protein